jgi:hypothetical protein
MIQILSAMKIQELKAEIIALEKQLTQYERLFEESIEKNVEFAHTRLIYQELKKITERLKEMRKLTE